MHCQYVSYDTSPLHRRGAASVPMTVGGHSVISPNAVSEAKVRTGLFGVGG